MRTEQIGLATLYLGDCREVLPLVKADAVITDPPYGMGYNTDSTRFKGPRGGHKQKARPIIGDDKPFDPEPFLNFRNVILWGSNHFSQRLPVGTTLIWIKRKDAAFGTFLSDAEIAWMKSGHGVYCKRGPFPQSISRNREHPAQKPIELMEWCVDKTNGAVFDPYMGSGTTGIACINKRREFIGCEIEPRYFDIACRRIEDAQRKA